MTEERKNYVIETQAGVIGVVRTSEHLELFGIKNFAERVNITYREISNIEAEHYSEVARQRKQETASIRFGANSLWLASQ